MAEQQAGPIGNEYLEKLKTEELEELLWGTVELPEEKRDRYISAITKELERREKEHPTGRLGDVEVAWEEFQIHFQTPEGEEMSLYPEEEEADRRPARRRKTNWRRIAIAAAVIVGLMIAVPPAFGYENFFVMMGQWNEEIFHFDIPGKEPEYRDDTSKEGYKSIQEALSANGVEAETLMPTRIPAEFVLKDIYVTEYTEAKKTDYNALYENGDKMISLYVIQRESRTTRNYEKDKIPVEEYVLNGTSYFIFSNNGKIFATWYVDEFECSIQTDLSVEEVKSMIDSIYEYER